LRHFALLVTKGRGGWCRIRCEAEAQTTCIEMFTGAPEWINDSVETVTATSASGRTKLALDVAFGLDDTERKRLEIAAYKAAYRYEERRERDDSPATGGGRRWTDGTNIVGDSPAIKELINHIARVAAHDFDVQVEGESGTGKELVAKAIHHDSNRRGGPFVAVNCAALHDSLIESELFGHERGAFTGAAGKRIGLIEAAHGGTLFLDEIGDLPPSAQAKLLRVLEEREVMRVGGTSPVKVDLRVITATNRDLRRMVLDGQFRHDLLRRLGVRVRTPALRERPEDVPLLINNYVARLCGAGGGRSAAAFELTEEAEQLLCEHRWEGNVRELQRVIEGLIVRHDDRNEAARPVTASEVCALLNEKFHEEHDAEPRSGSADGRIMLPEEAREVRADETLAKFLARLTLLVIGTVRVAMKSNAAAARRLGLCPSSLRMRWRNAKWRLAANGDVR